MSQSLEFGEAKFQSLMRQREGFHTCHRHVFHAQRQLCFHTAACSGIYIHRHSRCNSLSVATSYRCMSSGTSCLPKELKFANIGILKALETFSQGKEINCAMAIGCTAAYAAVTSRELRGSMNYTQSVYVNTPIRAYESAAGAAHEIPPEGGTKAALCAAWLWRTRQS